MAAIHQFLPVLSARDAIGAHALMLRDSLRAAGHTSEIWVEHTAADAIGESHRFDRYRGSGPDAVFVYQASIGCDLADWLMGRDEPLVVNYHNVTPPEVFEGWEPVIVPELVKGRRQLARLARRAQLAIAVSGFNARDLTELGVRTEVVPVLFDPARLGGTPDPVTLERLSAAQAGGGSDVLFVGRVSPNKAQHDLIKAFAAYRRCYDPSARLHLVGAESSDAYGRALRALVRTLRLSGSVQITGGVTEAELAAYYRGASVFACLSDHEGFCVPLLEAMHVGVPVVAYAAAAIPETVDDAALLLHTKHPVSVATAWARVLRDAPLHRELVARGRARVAALDPRRAARRMVELLEGVAAGAARDGAVAR